MIITLNMTLCYKETKEELFFKEQLGQKPKGCSETSSVSTTHRHGKHETLSNSQNKLSEQMGRKHCCQGGDPNSLRESESLHRLTDQPTQKCLYSPCQEDAGTDVGAGKGHRLVWGVPVSNWLCLDATFQVWRRHFFISFPHSSCTKVKAPLQLYSSSIRILAQNLAGPMAAVVKNAFPEEG